MALGVLIVFDVIFILNPYTCVLTSTCSTQPQVVSLNSLMQSISPFQNYTSYDSKKFFLEIQVGCAGKKKNDFFVFYILEYLFYSNIGAAFIISLIYIIIFITCRIRIRERIVQDYPAPAIASAPPPPPPQPHHEFPVAKTPPMPWTNQVTYAPYAPYAPY